ncbi:MAG: hypothetical protein PHQ32_00140 [Firmicutes bacterium]|nr:hypothetical protein [Bacillota bacterium]
MSNKEFSFAASAIMGLIGINIVIFGASIQMASNYEAGYFPKFLAKKNKSIPVYAIVCISVFLGLLILVGGLKQN